MSNKWLYLPAEIKVRELHGKVLLAAAAANKGYKVVLGRKAEVSKYMPYFPKGIFLGFGAQKNFKREYAALKKLGFSVALMDEEGLATFSDEMYKRLRLSAETLDEVSLFLAWGEKQKEVFESVTCTKKPPVYKTGNIRFDILRPEFKHLLTKEIQSIKERFGRTILVTSSFGSCNHFDGKDRYFQALREKNILQNKDDEVFYKRYFSLKESVFKAYLEVIPQISKAFPEHTIVVRPHPSEDYSVWEEAAEENDNVKIIHEGSIHPWLLSSDAAIHHFCTTALEGFAADRPTIGYRPFKDKKVENEFVYKGSLPAETPEELLAALRRIVEGDLSELNDIRQKEISTLKNHIENIEGSFAYNNILEAFDEHSFLVEGEINMFFIHVRRFKSFLGKIYNFLKGKLKANYIDHKFLTLSEKEIQDVLSDIRQSVPDIGEINIKKIDRLCYLITKA